jgi:hypothetical protein
MLIRTSSLVAGVVLLLTGATAMTLAASPATSSAPGIPAVPPSASPNAVAPSPVPSSPFDAAGFTATIDNVWFPLRPGQSYVYQGSTDGKPSIDTFEVTRETTMIDGTPCVVIHDTLTQGGKVVEETVDWYSQDRQGNVWYFGEDTRTLDSHGKVTSTEGSWKAGVDGARAGIYMPGNPQIGQSLQQESYAGHAEDHFVVLQTSVPVKVPFGSFTGALLTAEWTPLEPAVLSEKVYVPLLGQVREFDLTGASEHLELARIRTP